MLRALHKTVLGVMVKKLRKEDNNRAPGMRHFIFS
jgi:hypothetical protein